jgi:ribose transport system substrate-binding protein
MGRLVLAASLGLVLGLTGCGDSSPSGSSGSSGATNGKPLRVAVIPKGTSHEFWKAVEKGARAADAALPDLEIVWKGPQGEGDAAAQIAIVESFLADGFDGICLAPLDARALEPPVKTAIAQNVPVVIFDSGLASSDIGITSYVATDNVQGGRIAAQYLAERLGGKGKVVLLRYAVGSASTEQREAGFLEEIARHPGIELLSSDRHGGPDESKAIEVGENLAQTYGEQINGVFCSNESCTSGMLTALARDPRGLAAKVQVVGFDSSDRIVTALKEGRLSATVLQDPVAMGEKAVRAIHAKLTGKPVDARVQTGETLVTSQNVEDPAMRRLLFPLAD